ncbi:MAG TPA: NADH:ubiquinone oxidoreductase [Pararhizobium sp.]|uniref:NADH:ubiquinone oxidoreductase n=1 Tax=Pararhizobium sp. TaxID=1977563 RepID=UPI002CD691AD|nr:NADH:ubiquinone oxidoreductase [Pararhizobium sp.]HTO30104.1 NADH:ubiquinone oxidoreductase [Pararhizobium sp.]
MAKPDHGMDKDKEAGSAGPAFASGIGGGNDPFGMVEWLKDMPKVQLHPLIQHPAAAFAAATAIGIGMTSHVAGFMLGAMQGMAERAQTAASAETEKQAPVETPVRKPEPEAKPAVKVARPKRQKAATRVVETKADDLKKISGIGPKLEQVLNGMGVRRYADVALWTDKDMQRFDEHLGFSGRIARDGWVEQAKALMKGGN